jgi:hypothetical protein
MNAQENIDLQELRQRGYDTVADEIENGLKCWYDRLERQGCATAEGNTNREVVFHVHFTARGVGETAVPARYCIDLRFYARGCKITGDDGSVFPHCHVHPRDKGDADGEGAVLVDPVQLVQLPEWVRSEIVSSMVWLKRLDGVSGCGRHAADFPVLHVPRDSARFDNRELGTAYLPVGHDWGVGVGEREGQVVKRCPSVEQTVTEAQRQSGGHGAGAGDADATVFGFPTGSVNQVFGVTNFPVDTIDGPTVITGGTATILARNWVRVWLIDGFIWYAINPPLGVVLEKLQVFARPLKLEGEAAVAVHSILPASSNAGE